MEISEQNSPTITDRSGKIIAFGRDRFLNEICSGEFCCICGAQKESKEFNDEHVIPDWLLRHANLHSKSIMLPNGTKIAYGKYKIPCCADCNTFYGRELEEKISTLITSGYDYFTENVKDLKEKLFIWLAWVYFKTHFKDTKLALHRDKRKGEGTIASRYDLNWLHHIHAIARIPFTGVDLHPQCFGSLMVFRADEGDVHRLFDYRDVNYASTGLLRVSDIAILFCLNDAKICIPYLQSRLKAIGFNAMSPVQLREMLAHISYIRTLLSQSPAFRTELTLPDNTARILVQLPTNNELKPYDRLAYGKMLYLCLQDLIPRINFENQDEIIALIKNGAAGFLMDQDGNFVSQGSPTASR